MFTEVEGHRIGVAKVVQRGISPSPSDCVQTAKSACAPPPSARRRAGSATPGATDAGAVKTSRRGHGETEGSGVETRYAVAPWPNASKSGRGPGNRSGPTAAIFVDGRSPEGRFTQNSRLQTKPSRREGAPVEIAVVSGIDRCLKIAAPRAARRRARDTWGTRQPKGRAKKRERQTGWRLRRRPVSWD